MGIEIAWFKRDLRIHDNVPLCLVSSHKSVLPLYIFEPELWKEPDHSYRHYVFLKEALNDLDLQLKTVGASLTILVGSAESIFDQLNRQYKIDKIFSHQETWNLRTFKRDNIDIVFSNWILLSFIF